jgi:lysozyme
MARVNPKAAGAFGAVAIALTAVFLPRWEGWRNDPYLDIANVPTVCVGHTGGVQMDRAYSDGECKALLQRDLEEHAALIRPCVPADTPLASQVAFLSLAYNIGSTAFCTSTTARRLNAGDLAGACEAIERWNKARVNGQLRVVQGLVNRRRDERAMCERGVF